MSECRPSFMHRSAYGVKRTEVFGNRREDLSWHEELSFSKGARKVCSELYTLMPFGEGEVKEWLVYQYLSGGRVMTTNKSDVGKPYC